MVFAELGYSRNQFGAGKCLTKVQFGRRNHDNVAAMETQRTMGREASARASHATP